MRILNRPMFRYGGPIKEGVMHGMKNGGRAALVGNPVYPKTGGREHHAEVQEFDYNASATVPGSKKKLFGWEIPGTGLAVDPRTGKPYDPKYLREMMKKQREKDLSIASWMFPGMRAIKGAGWSYKLGKPAIKKLFQAPLSKSKDLTKYTGPVTPGSDKWFGNIFRPAYQGLKHNVKSGLAPLKDFKTAIGLGIPAGGYGLAKGYEAWKKRQTPDAPDLDGTKEIITETGVPGGGDKDMTYTDPDKAAKLAKDAQNKRLKSYLDLMGYDSAKKGALSDALIDASALVQDASTEAGSLKHADWGKLINQAIQTTSKRLDKPAQIREAVGLMATKAAIEKDLEDPQVKALRALEIKTKEKGLDPSPADLALAASGKTGKVTQDILENIVRSNEGVENFRASFKDKKGTAYGEWLDDNTNGSEMKFMNDIVKKESDFGAGFYVFPDRIVEVKDDLTMKYYY